MSEESPPPQSSHDGMNCKDSQLPGTTPSSSFPQSNVPPHARKHICIQSPFTGDAGERVDSSSQQTQWTPNATENDTEAALRTSSSKLQYDIKSSNSIIADSVDRHDTIEPKSECTVPEGKSFQRRGVLAISSPSTLHDDKEAERTISALLDQAAIIRQSLKPNPLQNPPASPDGHQSSLKSPTIRREPVLPLDMSKGLTSLPDETASVVMKPKQIPVESDFQQNQASVEEFVLPQFQSKGNPLIGYLNSLQRSQPSLEPPSHATTILACTSSPPTADNTKEMKTTLYQARLVGDRFSTQMAPQKRREPTINNPPGAQSWSTKGDLSHQKPKATPTTNQRPSIANVMQAAVATEAGAQQSRSGEAFEARMKQLGHTVTKPGQVTHPIRSNKSLAPTNSLASKLSHPATQKTNFESARNVRPVFEGPLCNACYQFGRMDSKCEHEEWSEACELLPQDIYTLAARVTALEPQGKEPVVVRYRGFSSLVELLKYDIDLGSKQQIRWPVDIRPTGEHFPIECKKWSEHAFNQVLRDILEYPKDFNHDDGAAERASERDKKCPLNRTFSNAAYHLVHQGPLFKWAEETRVVITSDEYNEPDRQRKEGLTERELAAGSIMD